MSNHKGLTKKQIEMLTPLERDANANRRTRDRFQRRLAIEQAIGFEENQVIHDRIKELDDEYANLSVGIAEIYNAHDEMMKHMARAIEEIKEVDRLKELYGFVTD